MPELLGIIVKSDWKIQEGWNVGRLELIYYLWLENPSAFLSGYFLTKAVKEALAQRILEFLKFGSGFLLQSKLMVERLPLIWDNINLDNIMNK